MLVKVSRALQNVNIKRNNASSAYISKELVGNVNKVVKGSRISATYTTTSRTLKIVKATT